VLAESHPASPKAPMRQSNVGAPLERIAIDVMGPLPTSTVGSHISLGMASDCGLMTVVLVLSISKYLHNALNKFDSKLVPWSVCSS
jgi:hypothetical protein